MSKPVAIVVLIVFIFFMAKFMEPTGPRTASAVGQYDAAQPVVRLPEVYRAPAPSKCTTTSWDGPYKHDGRTYSTVCN